MLPTQDDAHGTGMYVKRAAEKSFDVVPQARCSYLSKTLHVALKERTLDYCLLVRLARDEEVR